MELEDITLSEIREAEKDNALLYMWKLKWISQKQRAEQCVQSLGGAWDGAVERGWPMGAGCRVQLDRGTIVN